jgi:hypothetical protein
MPKIMVIAALADADAIDHPENLDEAQRRVA